MVEFTTFNLCAISSARSQPSPQVHLVWMIGFNAADCRRKTEHHLYAPSPFLCLTDVHLQRTAPRISCWCIGPVGRGRMLLRLLHFPIRPILSEWRQLPPLGVATITAAAATAAVSHQWLAS